MYSDVFDAISIIGDRPEKKISSLVTAVQLSLLFRLSATSDGTIVIIIIITTTTTTITTAAIIVLSVWLCRGRDLAETIQHLENFIEYENYDPEIADQSKLRYVPTQRHKRQDVVNVDSGDLVWPC